LRSARSPASAHQATWQPTRVWAHAWKSGTSITANMATRCGNHRLKNALFLAAFASLRHEPSRTHYDRKGAQGKRHNQAVLCLARRRVDVLDCDAQPGRAILRGGFSRSCRLTNKIGARYFRCAHVQVVLPGALVATARWMVHVRLQSSII